MGTMNQIEVNKQYTEDKTVNTSLKGTIHLTYDELVAKLGEPMPVNNDRVRVEWVLYDKHEDIVAVIYDWKWTHIPVQEVTEWNIGGHSHQAVELVNGLFNQRT